MKNYGLWGDICGTQLNIIAMFIGYYFIATSNYKMMLLVLIIQVTLLILQRHFYGLANRRIK